MAKEDKKRLKVSAVNLVGWLVIVVAIVAVIAFSVSSQQDVAGSQDEVLKVTTEDRQKGNPSAKVVIVEYGDFQCPYCASYSEIVGQIAEEYKEEVLIAYRHFPLIAAHRNAMTAAAAAEAAAAQGKFWEMHDILFEKQAEWSDEPSPTDKFISYADEIGIDTEAFRLALTDPKVISRVRDQLAAGERIGVNSTPTFYLNGEQIALAPDVQAFREAIDAKLAQEDDTADQP